jgi:hypothetical protein
MKKVNLREYYNSPKDRVRDRTVAIFEKVTALDWMKVPDLCRAFAQEFETTLLVQPMGSPRAFEICLILKGSETDLSEAEDFVDRFLSSGKKLTKESLRANV